MTVYLILNKEAILQGEKSDPTWCEARMYTASLNHHQILHDATKADMNNLTLHRSLISRS